MPSIQAQIGDNHCFGCGTLNAGGLHIQSYWDGQESRCEFQPAPTHMAGPAHIVNGGIISTIMDCHCICTAMAQAYQTAGRAIGSGERIWYATGKLEVDFLAPAPLAQVLTLRARIERAGSRKTQLSCDLFAGDQLCAQARVLAVRVPNAWFEGGV